MKTSSANSGLKSQKTVCAGLLIVFLIGIAPAVLADAIARPASPAPETTGFAPPSARLTPDQLDQYRGGFRSPDGFRFSLGIRSVSRINDEPLITQTLLQVNDVVSSLRDRTLSRVSGEAPNPAAPSVVIQNGPGNQVVQDALGAEQGLPQTIIQNSLNNQHIRHATIYDLELHNVRSITQSVQNSVNREQLGQALLDSIR